jgi:glycosyltransferase involved in cell wall biosynthesis
LAVKLGVGRRVRFLGWLDERSLDKAYGDASIVVMPSIWPEPFGKVGIDALARGRPVIAFDVGGISDWLRDGWNGFLIPPGDEACLAKRIERLLLDPSLASEFGANGKTQVTREFSPQKHLNQLLKIFETVSRA